MAKKQQSQAWNLFEPVSTTQQAENNSSEIQEAARTATQVKIRDACPRCGGRSLKTVRSYEHGGATHYCAGGCLSDDRTDAFYFTPRAETFDEQAEKEEAKKVVASEMPGQQIAREAFERVEEVIAATAEIQEIDNVPEQVEAATKIIEGSDLFGNPIEKKQAGALAERFLVPPFSVLDARQGYWTKRKAEWVGMGITSEDGRGDVMWNGDVKDLDYLRRREGKKTSRKGVLHTIDAGRKDGEEFDGGDCWVGSGSSIFDPVLCELTYKWFATEAGKILDPFAGGSVRGIVAAKLGYRYTGIELRQEQIDANTAQAEKIGVAPQWICGDSSKMDSLVPVPPYEEMFDMVFTCPPYYDLEEYSESAADGSAKQTYEEFLTWYKVIFGACVKRLKWNRFLVIVVGEIRDENGFYRNFVGDTISCMLSLGLRYYNEAILVTAVGSLPLRVNTQFGGYRKLGKTHQNVVVFYNGSNCDQIQEKFGNLL